MRLLLVEDNERLAAYLATALRNNGFAVDQVGTAADADGAIATTVAGIVRAEIGTMDLDHVQSNRSALIGKIKDAHDLQWRAVAHAFDSSGNPLQVDLDNLRVESKSIWS